ncbi:14997_t:CDS:1, partial [Acaulospora morrowiae]
PHLDSRSVEYKFPGYAGKKARVEGFPIDMFRVTISIETRDVTVCRFSVKISGRDEIEMRFVS